MAVWLLINGLLFPGAGDLGNMKPFSDHLPQWFHCLLACIMLMVLRAIVVFTKRSVPTRFQSVGAISCLTPFPFRSVYLQNSITSVFSRNLDHAGFLFLCVSLHMLCTAHGLFSFWFSSADVISFQTLFSEPKERKLDAKRALKLRPAIVNAQNKQAGKMREKSPNPFFWFCTAIF